MSLKVVETEIARFLSSDTPEVLCIKGKWGVGKTFGWRTFLRRARSNSALAINSYAYVSLFGLNSLDDLRYAIFENTVSGDRIGEGPDTTTLNDLLSKDNGRKLGKLGEIAAAFFNRKGVADLMAKSAFLLVRNQLICLDDLERAGSNLGAREVLGLASLLKDERKCKVVLLLNDEAHTEKEEFNLQLEKVADLTLSFDLSANEAASIAIAGDGHVASYLRLRTAALGITNIRVIKKIERLTNRLVELLEGHEQSLIESAVSTSVLAGWAVHQPNVAPKLSFLRSYNRIRLAVSGRQGNPDPEVSRYQAILDGYSFTAPNILDQAIMDGAESGYLTPERVSAAADQLARERAANLGDREFNAVWDEVYHGSLTSDDEVFLERLVAATMREAVAISSLNINSTVRLLREFGRDGDADRVVTRFMEVNAGRSVEFFNIENHHFISAEELDRGLRLAFEARLAAYRDERDPVAVVRGVASTRSWSEGDVLLLSRQSVEDFVRIFEALQGDEVRLGIEMVLAIGHTTKQDNNHIRATAQEALRTIAAKSPLRARKLSKYIDSATGEDAPQVLLEPVAEVDNTASVKS